MEQVDFRGNADATLKLPGRVLQHWFGALVGSLLAMAVGVVFLNPYIGGGLHRLSFDLPFACSFAVPAAPPDVVLVTLDDESHRVLGQDYGVPWDPALHGLLLERLRRAGARLVVFDILFQEQRSVDYTPLVSAMQKFGGAIIGSSLRFRGETSETRKPVVDPPRPMLLSAALTNGVVEFDADPDLTVRRLLPLIPGAKPGAGGGARTNYATLAWVAASAASGGKLQVDPASPPLGWFLNYYGPPGTIERVSYWSVLSNAHEVAVSNRVVFVGEQHRVWFTGSGAAPSDTFRSPYPLQWRFDGVEVHATACANLLEQRWLREIPALLTFLLIVAGGVLSGSLLVRWHPLAGLGIAMGLALGVCLLACALQTWLRLWFPWAIILAVQIPVGLVWGIVFHATKAHVQSSFLERSLALYLSPKQVSHLLKHPEMLRPGGHEQLVSILYSDIADFSRRAERMDAAGLLNWLNRYYDAAIACIHRQDGTVMNLIGDAIFALWNAPQPQPDHVARACQAAFLLSEKSTGLDETSAGLPLRTRIGLHTGTACVGNLGSSDHFDYTAIGDAVNLTSRLEGLNKALGTSILATRDFVREIEAYVLSRPVGHFRFKGFDRVVEVHELLEFGPSTDRAAAPWRDQFALGLHHFRRRAWEAAEAAFLETRRLRGGDGPSQFYLERILALRGEPPPSEWAGEIDLKEK